MITDAIILAGGFGTRLRPLTLERPKPLLPVNNRPFLETQFKRLKDCGVKRVHLSVFHQADKIKKALPGLKKSGLKVLLLREKEPLGTGGAIRYAWPDKEKACLVLNGDVLSDAEIRPLQKAHEASNAAATLWLIEVGDTSAYGVAELDREGRILRFVEKPRPGESKSRLINAGLYALEPEVLSLIPEGRAVSVEREVFPQLLASGAKVLGFRDRKAPYWNDIGTPAAYLRANLDAAAGKVRIRGFWKRSGLAKNVIAKGCMVAKDAVLERCVLLEGAKVGSKAVLKNAILGPRAKVGAGVHLGEGAVLGAGTVVSAQSLL